VGPKPSFFYTESRSLITYSEAFDPDRYLGDDLSCLESAAQPDAMMRDHWTFGAGYVDLVTLVDSFKLLIRPFPAVVFVLESIAQRGRYGWQYLAFYGASRYSLPLVNRSVLTTGKAKTEERRSHSECILSRDTKMWPPYCQAARVRWANGHIKTGYFLCSACLHTLVCGSCGAQTFFYSSMHSHFVPSHTFSHVASIRSPAACSHV